MSSYMHLAYFMLIIIFGVGLEVVISKLSFRNRSGKIKHRIVHFKLKRYFFLLSIPLVSTLFMTYLLSYSIVFAFIGFALVGAFLEYCIGYSYHVIVGQRLWTYHKYNINTYTSWLTLPFWGLCGVMIFLISRALA